MYALWKSYGKIISFNDKMHWGEKHTALIERGVERSIEIGALYFFFACFDLMN